MKYFDGAGAENVDVFRESQRADGMIWDFFARGEPGNFYDTSYGPLGYATWLDGLQFVRMPVEADVEYLFVEGVYFAWKMTADDAWMRRQLDAAVRAMDYSFTDRARFSTKHGLVKRGYTIDTWDFQVDDEWTRIFPRWGTLLIDPDRSKFGVMFGDNTGYAASCGYLAEMLERAGRRGRGRAASGTGRRTSARASTAWPGPGPTSATGSPRTRRSSGTWAWTSGPRSRSPTPTRSTAGSRHEQATAILRTYQGIRASLPPGSPGEWYAIYPPFAKGFGDHSEAWQYVNGGVSPIFAGELARGAFAHGFEAYGADILSRVLDLAKAHGDHVWFAYTGAYPKTPEPSLTPIDLSRHANMDTGGQGAPGVPGWMATMPDDHMANLPTGAQTFGGIPFLVADPATNGRRGAIAVSRRPGFPERVEVPLGRKAGSIYVLHTTGDNGNTKLAGSITFVYEDGTDATQYVVRDGNVAHWWYPSLEGELAARVRPAAPAAPREARLEGEERGLPDDRPLLVRPRQPAPGEAGEGRRLLEHARPGDLRGPGPDRLRSAAPPAGARGVVRRAGQLGRGRGRLRPRRGPGRRRGRGRRLPRGRRLATVARGRDERRAGDDPLPGLGRLRGLRLPPRPGEARDRADGHRQRREGRVPRAAARGRHGGDGGDRRRRRRSPSRPRASSPRPTPTSRSPCPARGRCGSATER